MYLTARRRPVSNPPIDAHPRFKADGTYKILQVADLHLSVNEEPCRDVDWESPTRPCRSFQDTVAHLNKWLDDEKPDLVVLTGDQLNGQGTSWDPKSVMPTILAPFIDRKIQWAAILGNHDSQTGPLSRPEIELHLSLLPYSLTRVGPAELHDHEGAGNYYINIMSPAADRTNLFNLYFFDSGADAPKHFWTLSSKYDWIRQDQVEWFLKQSAKVRKILRPYRPDGAADLPKLDWIESEGARNTRPAEPRQEESWDAGASQGQTMTKPNAIAFVHIPLPEFFSVGGDIRMGPNATEASSIHGAQSQGGFFQAIQDQEGAGDRDVRAIVSGHVHNNAWCKSINDSKGKPDFLWGCFAGGSSVSLS